MADEWNSDEIVMAVRAYMWARRSEEAGNAVNKEKVIQALAPNSPETRSSVIVLFRNISTVLEEKGIPVLQGYPPERTLSPVELKLIADIEDAYRTGTKSAKRASRLVQALPAEIVKRAAEELANGAAFKFPDSTTYDVVTDNGVRLAPKRVVGYSAQLYYGAPMKPVDFAGGAGSLSFGRLEAAGLSVVFKDQDEQKFQKEVTKLKKRGFKNPPKGCDNPLKTVTESVSFQRDPAVVAFVLLRAKGICECCEKPAPFKKVNGEPFLEVHHIVPLAEDGADTVENAAAICPNCHRESHHGERALEIRVTLKENLRNLP